MVRKDGSQLWRLGCIGLRTDSPFHPRSACQLCPCPAWFGHWRPCGALRHQAWVTMVETEEEWSHFLHTRYRLVLWKSTGD